MSGYEHTFWCKLSTFNALHIVLFFSIFVNGNRKERGKQWIKEVFHIVERNYICVVNLFKILRSWSFKFAFGRRREREKKWYILILLIFRIVTQFVVSFSSKSRIFHSFGDVIIADGGLHFFSHARHLWPLSNEVL